MMVPHLCLGFGCYHYVAVDAPALNVALHIPTIFPTCRKCSYSMLVRDIGQANTIIRRMTCPKCARFLDYYPYVLE